MSTATTSNATNGHAKPSRLFDLPERVLANGVVMYKLNGKLHREDGPAIERVDGSRAWYCNGVRHNSNGPAVIDSEGNKFWYLDGYLHRDNDLPAVEYKDGTKYWYQYGLCHRGEDKPAIITAHGTSFWYSEGKRHRVGKPAVVFKGGAQHWWLNDERHREDGPASILHKGRLKWYLHGQKFDSEQAFKTALAKLIRAREYVTAYAAGDVADDDAYDEANSYSEIESEDHRRDEFDDEFNGEYYPAETKDAGNQSLPCTPQVAVAEQTTEEEEPCKPSEDSLLALLSIIPQQLHGSLRVSSPLFIELETGRLAICSAEDAQQLARLFYA